MMVARWYQKINHPLLKTEVIAKEHNYHNERNKISFTVVVPIKQQPVMILDRVITFKI
jgi:hypothetical protein